MKELSISELPIADYLRMVRLFVSLGVEKIRLTGGEPLLRSGLVEMVQEIARMRTAYLEDGTKALPGEGLPLDIALTTNGHLLEGLAQPLKDAGLQRVTVSMDAVDAETFAAITRVPRSFDKVLAGMRKAGEVGLGPVKVNCVLLRGFNDGQVEQFAEFSRREGAIYRVDAAGGRSQLEAGDSNHDGGDRGAAECVSSAGGAACAWRRARRRGGLHSTMGWGRSGLSRRFRGPFCGHCSRVRLTSDGRYGRVCSRRATMT